MPTIHDFERELFRRSPPSFANWFSIDLHNHSPSSFDYRGDRSNAATLSAAQISRTGLSLVMFTDHAKLPDPTFASEVARLSGATVMRGTELNVFVDAWGKPEGKVDRNLFFHLLLGFDPDGQQTPEYWLTHIYKSCGDEIRTCGNDQVRGITASLDVLHSILNDSNAIVIPAHLHSTRDAFRSRSIDDIYTDPIFLRHVQDHFTALEVTDPRTAAFFDGTHEETGNIRKACIRSSDAHEPELLGTRVSYAQMETPTFGELKAALELPFRVSLTEPITPQSYVIGMHIEGRFFPDLWLSLSPHCNALIGVKGAGKTSLLEALRFAVGAPVPASKQELVDKHLQSILGPNGKVRVLIKRSDGAKVLVERSLASRRFLLTFENDRVESLERPEGLLFPTYILGWHEIEQAATDANIRQLYLDTIAGRDQIRSLYESADASAKRIRHLHEVASNKYAAFRALHEQVRRLQELRQGLLELQESNLIALRDRYETAVRHQTAVMHLELALQKAIDSVDPRTKRLGVPLDRNSIEGDSPIATLTAGAFDVASEVTTAVTAFSIAHKDLLQSVRDRVAALRLQIDEGFETFRATYAAEVNLLPDEQRTLLESHQRVMNDTKALPQLQAERDTQKEEVDSVLNELVDLCDSVANALDQRTQLRQAKVAALNAELEPFGVQLGVDPLSIKGKLDALNQKFSNGAQIYGHVSSFAQHEQRYHRRLAAAYRDLKANLVDGFRLLFDSVEFANFVDYFEEDDLKISFKVGKAGEEFSPIDQLSAGQRCTAIFPLLLRMEQGPLIIDQPEDNLDNRHIADVVSPVLLVDKRARQIAFTSHNANLVVLTDAEQIASFEATGVEGRVESRGFLCASHSPITDAVIGILDGGERALDLRYRKYGAARASRAR